MIVDFPAPVAPTIPTRSPGLDLERHVLQNEVGAVVGERHVVEDDVTRCVRGRAVRGCARRSRAGSAVRSPASGVPIAIFTSVSSSLKIRSLEAIAAWRMLNFSDRSLIGR